MIHFTCDMCGSKIRNERYSVNIEVAAAFDPNELTAEHLEEDHLAMIAEQIDLMDSTAEFKLEETGPQKRQYDLCDRCCQSYLKNPLQRHAPVSRPKFSHN